MRNLGALRLLMAAVILAAATIPLWNGSPATAAEPCAAPVVNKVACENTKPGDTPSDWQVNGIGDSTIQGYATSMSVNVGQTVNFKIKTPASSYHIDILRLGYYGGNGARLIASNIKPTASLPQTQPNCLTNSSTGLVDCGNWNVSASWTVPSEAVSGLYMAHLVRNDTGGESQILFVVREDSSHSDLVYKTSDTTWEAYNAYGGNSLYSCTVSCPPGNPGGYKAAYAVSYNRPFDGTLERDGGFSDPFYAEYQLIRFLERNGYDMSYVSGHDVDANGSLLQNHKVVISSGHDEYWSPGERQAVESARSAGVSLAFFSGNEMFWKTRWGNSSEGSNTPYRTLITYKDTHFPTPVDPLGPSVTTPTWRDPRFSPPGDAGRPESSVTGQDFMVNSGTSEIKVPGTFAKLRFWRNTAVSTLTSGQTLTLAPGTGTLGYEWDTNPDNGFRPPGRISLSSTTVSGVETFTDYGTGVESGNTATHSLSLYRAPSGALVFGSGTVQWSWGLDVTNAWNSAGPNGNAPDPTMQQATVNLLADMGAQPATLQSGLVAQSTSTDTTPPSATVASPSEGAGLADGSTATISGTATDAGGGVVAAVEVSTDGGATWHTANGTSSWTYPWIVHGAPSTTIRARAVDDSGNIGAASAARTVSVSCPCSIFNGMTPESPDSHDSNSVELGIKFRSDVAGQISGIRFYKASTNTGTHVGSLWTSSGTLLVQATFTGETSSGWQQVNFPSPVAIQPNTTYVAGYFAPSGHYSQTEFAIERPPALGPNILDSPPLHVLPNAGNGNGVYQYTQSTTFPQNTYQSENYWVDVAFTPTGPTQPPGPVTNVTATAGVLQATVNWTPPTTGGAVASYRITPYIGSTAQTPTTVNAPASSKTITGLTGGTTYTFTVTAINEKGSGPESSPSNAVTPTIPSPPGAPTGVSATAGPLQATVSWTAPASDGGSPITNYRVTPYIGSSPQSPTSVPAPAASATITGLTGGTTYTFKVAAINPAGAGQDSATSNAVTPTSPTAPGAPTGVSAGAGGLQATVTWTAPESDGGSPITSYVVIPYVGSTAQTPTMVNPPATSKTITGLTSGTTYTFKVAAVNAIGQGSESAASNPITPTNLAVDLLVAAHPTSASTSISSPAFSTPAPGELLLAFITSDGPSGTQSFSSVTGGNLTWRLRRRANTQAGTSEIWQANAATTLSNATVTATRSSGSYMGSIAVAAISGADQVAEGATAGGSGATGAPSVSLTTTRAGSWVWGVGNDWDSATERTIGPNQTKVDEFLASAGDTFWVQRQTATTPLSGTQVTLNDTAPTNDRWNLAAVEVVPAQAQNPPPPAPTLSSTVPASPANQNSPKVLGSAAAGAQVSIYSTSGCTGTPLATGTAAELGTGITVAVADNSTTAFRATATASGNTSSCSAPLTYVEDSAAPDTTITSGPTGTTNDSTPTFGFSSSESGSSFECRFDAAAFAACSGPGATHTPTVALADGEHSFEVRAADQAGNVDPSPASRSFTVNTVIPPAPTLSSTVPASPANQNSPKVLGSAAAGSQVSIYSTSGCTGTPLATGTAAELGTGFTVAVADNSTTAFRATATASGNTSSCSAPLTYVEDSAAPQTLIGAHPPALSASASASFEFSGEDPGGSGVASLQCRLDSTEASAWAACTSPKTYSGLADGGHRFEARATDQAGNIDASPAAFEWQIDTTPPTAVIDAGPTGTTNDSTPTFEFHSTETGSTFACSIDTGTPSFGPCSGPGASHTPTTPLADGTYTFRVRATDPAGNPSTPATRSFTVNTAATPAPTLSSTVPASPANQNSPKVLGSAAAGSQVSIYSTSGCTGTPLATGTAAELGTGITVAVADNSTTAFRATATASGNTSSCSAPLTYVEDSAAPDTTITSGPNGTTNDSTPTFGFSSSESGSSFECRFDAAAFAACSGPGATHTPTVALADGEHSFEVRAADQAGNVDPSPASRSFTVNTVIPPAPTLSSTVPASPANQNSPKVLGSAAAGSQVSIYSTSGCTGTPLATGTAAELGTGITVAVADNSTTAFRATATASGNTSSCSAPLTYVEDSAAPQTLIGAHPPALSASASASFEFSGEDPGGSGVASLQCRLDSTEASAWAACTSPKTYSGLADGGHRFEARATDQAGNIDASPAVFEWQIDTTPPTAVIDAGPTGTTNDSTPTFEFHSTETGSTFACSIDTGTPSFGPCSGPGASHTPTTPLADGTYTFRVRATDPAGNPSTPATRSFTVAAGTPPGAPTAVTATAKSSGAQLGWTAPSSSGGSPITSYRITPYIGSTAQSPATTGSTATSASVGGLTNGTSYTFKVAAINSSGPGPDSTASAAVTPYDTIFDLANPGTVDSGDAGAVELGVKFRSDVAGTVNGIRFYKAAANTGTHVGSLWSSTGTLLAQNTFTGETASGWQQVKFSSPVTIQANTTYVAGYLAPKGHYSVNGPTLAAGVDNAPLHAIANSTSSNGLYIYGTTARFPTNTYQSSNYWVDVLFTPPAAAQPPGQVTNVSATAGQQQATVNWTPPAGEAETVTSYRITPYVGSTAQSPTTVIAPATSKAVTGLTAGTAYTFTVTAINPAGAGPESAKSNSVTPTGAGSPEAPTGVAAEARNQSAVVSWTPGGDGGSQITGYRITPFVGSTAQSQTTVSGAATSATVSALANGTNYTFIVTALNGVGAGPASAASNAVMPRATIFEQGVPAILEDVDANSVELGVKFTSETAGTIRGIRFYKSAENIGPHVVSLWSAAGALLAQATASGETESGWQEVSFASPVPIAANTTYVAAYLAPGGHYSATSQAFETAIDSPPLHAVANSASSNGVYGYSSTSTFPTSTFNATNYWVDVLFTP